MKKTIQYITSLFCLALGAGLVHADSGVWDRVNIKTGNWSTSTSWQGGIIATGASFTATCPSGGGNVNITVDIPHTIGNLYMIVNGANRAIALKGSTITLSGGGSGETIRATDGPLHVECVIAGSEGVRIRTYGGSGRVFLGAANTYTGDTLLTQNGGGGMIVVSNANAIPHGPGYGNVVFWDNDEEHGILNISSNDITVNALSTIVGVGTTGGIITTLGAEAGTTTLTVGDGDASGIFTGSIVESTRQIALTKIGGGTQTMTCDTNLYTGATIVNGGTLNMVGSIYGTVTVNAGGNFGVGASPGTATLYNQRLDFSAGGTNVWELAANSDSNPGTDFDQIIYYGYNSGEPENSLLLEDGHLLVRLTGSVDTGDLGFWGNPHTWNIIDSFGFGTGSEIFSSITVVGGTPPGNFTLENTGNAVQLKFTPGAVPPTPTFPKITSVVKTATSATVNYTNTLAGTNYTLQYRTNIALGTWTTVGSQVASGTTDSQTDGSAGTAPRFYRVYYFFAP